jgi:hypothetical protein
MDHTNRTIHAAFPGVAGECIAAITHPPREAILAGVLTDYAVDGGAEELTRELTHAACAYLGAAPPGDLPATVA